LWRSVELVNFGTATLRKYAKQWLQSSFISKHCTPCPDDRGIPVLSSPNCLIRWFRGAECSGIPRRKWEISTGVAA
jgi:hypothetical protein